MAWQNLNRGNKMGLQTEKQTYEIILQRLEAITQELQQLRNIVRTAQTQSSSENLAQKLFGVLGQGTWAEYDLTLDWQRFEA